jgi:hypothetical protein
MGLVGDPERDSAADAIGSAYVRGYLSDGELSQRLDVALSARSTRELSASVRDLPGGGWLILSALSRPFLSARRQTLRQRAGGLLRWLAFALLAGTSAVVLLGLGLWTLAAGLSGEVALAFVLVWLALSAPAFLIWRSARRLLR